MLGHRSITEHPNSEGVITAGDRCSGCNKLATIRAETTCRTLQRSSRLFHRIISIVDFEALFGPAQPYAHGGWQNIFGAKDKLEIAPEGVDKTYKLSLVRHFLQHMVSPEFKKLRAGVVKVMRPFVHCALQYQLRVTPSGFKYGARLWSPHTTWLMRNLRLTRARSSEY
ncbi:hypothetical protein V8D89_001203 [Ganoderma adspersum]